MRLLVTVPWARRLGGAEVILQTVLDGAGDTDFEIVLVFFEHGPWAKELAESGFTVEVITSGRLRELHRYTAAVARLAGIFRKCRPDMILNWSAKTQLYGAPAAALAGMAGRVVWWQHDIPPRRGINLVATALPTRAVGCNSYSAARAQQRLYPRRATFVAHAGARVPALSGSPPPLELPHGVPIVGLVGRLQPWKGQDRLLRAHALLRERGHAMHTVIVGGDSYGLSPQYASSLPALIDELGLSREVTMTGEVPDAGPYIEQLDVLVNASDPEPFGMVLLEAMARGIAVVAVNSGGPTELVEHERTGMLARSGEPDALADALEPLLRSSGRREAIATAGRERFMADLTDAAMQRRHFALFEEMRKRLR